VQEVDVVVLGAGAAGMMTAIEAGKRGRRVLVLDHADKVGKKILISGGGRSNFTNLHCEASNFLSENPHFAKGPLKRFEPADMVALVEKHGIPYHEKTLGQLFCHRSARDIVMLLEREAAEAGVRIALETRLLALAAGRGEGTARRPTGFTLTTSAGEIRALSVVVATGGLSIPKMGATGIGYELARQFGLRVVEPRPGLVPFTLGGTEHEAWCDLAGVSAEVEARVLPRQPAKRGLAAPEFREKMLVTHRGLSGPAILQISSYWAPGDSIEIDLTPDRQLFAPLLEPRARRDSQAALNCLRGVLPARWAERFMDVYATEFAGREMTNQAIAELERQVHGWRLQPAGTEGFAKAEVTAGGVDTAELDGRTMQARNVPGFYFVGEVVDVTGWLGGYNFQWAWASGVCAGQVA
jgi:predicted Rossmann fold flavoprotein